jgi:hypothetical protein
MTSIHVLLAASLVVLGADTRDILREHVKPDGQVGSRLADDTGWNTVHGYRWQMLLVNDQTGEQTSVKPDQAFRTGTAFKLRIETYTDLYIYVLNVNSDKTVTTLFPEQSEQHLLLRAGQSAKVPPDPPPPQRDQFRFTPPSGAEKFYILASPKKLDWANSSQYLPAEQKSANTKALDEAVERAETSTVRGKALAKLIDELKHRPSARTKDIDLLPPSTDGGQDAIHGSPISSDPRPFLVPVVLQHRE